MTQTYSEMLTTIYKRNKFVPTAKPAQVQKHTAIEQARGAFFKRKRGKHLDYNPYRRCVAILVLKGIPPTDVRAWLKDLAENYPLTSEEILGVDAFVRLYENGQFQLFSSERIQCDFNGKPYDYGSITREEVMRLHGVVPSLIEVKR